MTDRPIIFSAPMVRALLDGRKTQTRRFICKRAAHDALAAFGPNFLTLPGNVDLVGYVTGDRLWVRENFMPAPMETPPKEPRDTRWSIAYGAGGQAETTAPTGYNPMLYNYERWSPSIHMPRWASRLTLIVTDVRVQRLQEISEADAIADGCSCDSDGWRDYQMPATQCCATARDSYRTLWNSLYGPEAWDANPWVSAISFRTIHANIDSTEAAA